MLFKVRLPVHDGRVLCPRIGAWRDYQDCVRCRDLRRVSQDEATGRAVVECRPYRDESIRAMGLGTRT